MRASSRLLSLGKSRREGLSLRVELVLLEELPQVAQIGAKDTCKLGWCHAVQGVEDVLFHLGLADGLHLEEEALVEDALGNGPERLDAVEGRAVGDLLERLKVLVDEGLAGSVRVGAVPVVE